jgi:hypothetical protein
MRTLPTEIIQGEFRLTQVQRAGHLAIYEKSTKTGISCGFEVIKIRESKERNAVVAGKPRHFPAMEVYPTSEDWGQRGWTYQNLKDAETRFAKLAVLAGRQ